MRGNLVGIVKWWNKANILTLTLGLWLLVLLCQKLFYHWLLNYKHFLHKSPLLPWTHFLLCKPKDQDHWFYENHDQHHLPQLCSESWRESQWNKLVQIIFFLLKTRYIGRTIQQKLLHLELSTKNADIRACRGCRRTLFTPVGTSWPPWQLSWYQNTSINFLHGSLVIKQ